MMPCIENISVQKCQWHNSFPKLILAGVYTVQPSLAGV